MKSLLSPGMVKRSLSGHSWLGLLAGALMYLTCLSGTVAVLYIDFERWEQPAAPEFLTYDSAILERAYAEMLQRGAEDTHHVTFDLPTKEMPRATISTDTRAWFVNSDGSLSGELRHDWTHMLTDLHNTLHLPYNIGFKVVSLLGALLCGLIISGFLSHPSIFKEAFSFRRQGSWRLEQVDLHNRLSVWGAPFHLMIAITGAFFGLTVLFRMVAGVAFLDGDALDAYYKIYGSEPEVVNEEIVPPAISRAVDQVRERFPETPPYTLTVDHADEPEAMFMIVGTRHYDRMIRGEQHRFDAAGNYLGNIGYSDGEPGRQAVNSIYRLHFGSFAGWLVKLLYIGFGLALTVVAATGINIWLIRRKTRDYLNNLWVGVIWGAPAALALTAVAGVLLNLPAAALFWLALLAALAAMQWLDDETRGKAYLQAVTGGLLAVLVTGHLLRFGDAALGPAALGINSGLLGLAILFLFMGVRKLHTLHQTNRKLDVYPSPSLDG